MHEALGSSHSRKQKEKEERKEGRMKGGRR
jgi:hypothetical protein